jgi:hypothetical protein
MSILPLLCLLASGPIYAGTEHNVRVQIPRVDATVQLDGQLSEPVWQDAARLTAFSEYYPDDGRAAPEETEVLVWYSPTAIYFGIRAHAAPGTVRATLADRDHIDQDDSVQIMLSTFNDARQASVFGVNPLGVQMDGAVVEAGNGGNTGFSGDAGGRPQPDLSPDFVFESKGHLTDYGYEIEVRIPFKSLRYQSAPAQDWGLHVIRRIQSTGHEDSWAPARRTAASFLAQSGALVGLTELHRGLVMDLNPVVTAHADGESLPDGWTYDGHRPDVGANVRWGVTPNLTLNGTVNPDFSQVEADQTQFQIDPRQALFFPEKRPFFLDGIEFFQTPDNLIYSRRIVAPVAAVKLTGKVAGTTVAVMSAVDDSAQSIDGRSNPIFTIARVQHDLGAASTAGLVYTERDENGYTNRVAGVDSHLVWNKVYSLDLQGAFSHTARGGGPSTTGALWQADLHRGGRRFSFTYSIDANDPDFQAASGFIGRSGVVFANVQHQLALYGRQGALVEKWTGDVQLQGTWNYEDLFNGTMPIERKLHFNSNLFFRGGWHTTTSLLIERYAYDPSIYSAYGVLDTGMVQPFVGATIPNRDYVVALDTPRVHGVSANILAIWGHDENFFEWASAKIVYATALIAWRPTERLRVDFSHNLQSFERRTDNSYVGIRRVPRVKVEYQATRAIFFRYVGEYSGNYQDDLRDDTRTGLPIVFANPDGSFTPASGVRQASFRNDWLFSYQPTPGTVFFAGYGATLANDYPQRSSLARTTDGFFVKFSYLFRM